MKKPTLSLPMTVGRAIAELAIIVAGVLIALGAQAWWEESRETQEATIALRSIRDDLGPLRRVLASDSVRALELRNSLLMIIEEVDLEALPDSVRITTVSDAAWHHTGTGGYELPAYRDLESSGRLRLLPDSLRLRVTGYENALRQLDGGYRDLVQIQESRLDPWVLQEFDARRVMWHPGIGYDFQGVPEVTPFETRVGRNLAAGKYALVRGLYNELGRQLERTDSLVAALDRALQR